MHANIMSVILEQIVAGAAAGCVSAVVTVPLDVIKTRYQVRMHHSIGAYKSLNDAVYKILRDEGYRGFYRGVTPSILALLPNWAVYFTTYDLLKGKCIRRFLDKKYEPYIHSVCAMSSGAISTLVTAPLWMIKARMMIQHYDPAAPQYKHTFDAFSQIIQREGILGLYKGLSASIFGIFHVGVQLPIYEWIKHYRINSIKDKIAERNRNRNAGTAGRNYFSNYSLYEIRSDNSDAQDNNNNNNNNNSAVIKSYYIDDAMQKKIKSSSKEELDHIHSEILPRSSEYSMLTTFDIIFATTVSKIVASTIWYPHEVIRTRMQTSTTPTRVRVIVTTMIKQGGILSLWRGLGVTQVRAVPTSIVTFTVYEKLIQYFKENDSFK